MFGLHAGELVDAVFASLHEGVDARLDVAGDEVLDVAFALQIQRFFDFDFDPQPLAVEPLLVAQFAAIHREVAVEGILVRAVPGMVDAHRVVRGNRPIEERPRRLARVQCLPLLEDAVRFPERQNLPLERGEIDLRLNLLKRHRRNLVSAEEPLM